MEKIYRNSDEALDLSAAEMLSLWKERLGLTLPHRECTIEVADGLNVDQRLAKEIEEWYLQLLMTAPAEYLPVDDVVAEIETTITDDLVCECTLPPHAVRPVLFQMQGWSQPITQFHKPSEPIALRQKSPYLRGRQTNPVGVDRGDKILLYSAGSSTSQLLTALCVVRPANGRYILHRSLLSQ